MKYNTSVESLKRGPDLAENDQQPLHIRPRGNTLPLHTFEQQMPHYFHDFSPLRQEGLRVYHPPSAPLLRRHLLSLPHSEGKLVHEDAVEAHSKTHDIAFLVFEVVGLDAPVREAVIKQGMVGKMSLLVLLGLIILWREISV